MLSAEEYHVLEEQVEQLNIENDVCQQKITILLENNKEIPLLKKSIKKIKKEIAESEAEYEKTIETLNEQLNDHSSITRSPSKSLSITTSLNSLLGFPDDIQYNTAKSKLDTENERFEQLVNEEIQVAESLEKSANKEQILSNKIQDLINFIQKCEVLKPQVETYLGCGLYIQDLVSRLDDVKKQRKIQKGRQYRLNNWIAQTNAVHDSQMQIFNGLEKDLVNLGNKHKELEDDYHQVEILLRNETTKFNQEEFNILEALESKEKYEKETMNLVDQSNKKLEEMRNSIPKIDEQMKQIQNEINSHGVKKKKLLQKKLEMVQQLKKRITMERKAMQKQDISSELVMELTQVEENHLLEKEKIEKEVRLIEDKLKWLQANAEKKKQIIEELDKSVFPMDEPVSDSQCMKMFAQSLEEVKITNSALLSDMQEIGMELAGIEGENESLRTILSSLE
ncbi:hypothetical protein TRFO_06437 [Tritrichomonas foetus]|uniref:Uncharacterized protein n=1 Tax=Tritrichomonas foetus TaxID=1144522 RepID=A0A1J4JY96_9EUKA|nr:hypothetical protein TRFO_06437 [Tritrichomonas foetus]|eukprot:OHT04129.1 hypothetical protein TRFO_06437 [Tritrichomonas foetus]